MWIELAKDAGFCFGVRQAVERVRGVLGGERRVWALAPLVHNEPVMRTLQEAGLLLAKSLQQIERGDLLVVPSHGASVEDLSAARERGIEVLDLTCPRVRRSQEAARRLTAEGRRVLIVGDPGHAEVRSVSSWAGGGATVVAGLGDVEKLPPGGRWAVLTQTTARKDEAEAIVRAIGSRSAEVTLEPTACQVAAEMQQTVRKLAGQVDVMIVVGGKTSANTANLAAISLTAGTRTHHVEEAAEIDPSWLDKAARVGIAAGASTPDWLIEEVVAKVKEIDERQEAQRAEQPAGGPAEGEAEHAAGAGPGRDATQSDQQQQKAAGLAEPEERAETKPPAASEPPAVSEPPTASEAPAVSEAPAAAEVPAAGEVCTASEAAKAGEPPAAAEVPAAGEVCTASEAVKAGEPPAAGAAVPEAPQQPLSMEGVKMLSPGDVVAGRVVEVRPGEGVLVDVGYKSEGLIPLSELARRSVADPFSLVSPGQEIYVQVLRIEGEEGTLVLSKRRADEERAWGSLQAAFASGTPVQGRVTQAVKGGLLMDVGLRAFLPASHTGTEFVRDLSPYVGKEIKAKVIEIDRKERKVILSERAYLEQERKSKAESLWTEISEGRVLTGVVKRLTDFGAFVDLGGVDGLLHISELSWGRVNHPSEVVHEGETIQVKVLRVDRERNRISLGKKQVGPDPWTAAAAKYAAGAIVMGTVVRLVPFGAFVQLEDGIDGLVHISQIADHRVAKPDDVLEVGQRVRVKVLAVSSEGKRISLSIREVEQDRSRTEYRSYMATQATGEVTVGEMLAARNADEGRHEKPARAEAAATADEAVPEPVPEPAPQEPEVKGPAADETPSAEEPVSEKPTAEMPAAEMPAAEKPEPEKPAPAA